MFEFIRYKCWSFLAFIALLGIASSSQGAGMQMVEEYAIQIQQSAVNLDGSEPQDLWFTGRGRMYEEDGVVMSTWSYNGNICLGHLAKGFAGLLNGVEGAKGHYLTGVPVRPGEEQLLIPSGGILGAGGGVEYPIVDLMGTQQLISSEGSPRLFPFLPFDFASGVTAYDILDGKTFFAVLELVITNVHQPTYDRIKALFDRTGNPGLEGLLFEVGQHIVLMFTWTFTEDIAIDKPITVNHPTGGWFYVPDTQLFVPFLDEELLMLQMKKIKVPAK